MKSRSVPLPLRRLSHNLLFGWLLLILSSSTRAQSTAEPHGFSAITPSSSGDVQLQLAGTPSLALRKLYDLFPIEHSVDLVHWQPLTTVLRTNVTNAVVYLDVGAAQNSARYYRTPTNHLSTPFEAPTGPYPVGTFSRVLTDPTRKNRYGVPGVSNFVVTFWYPAAPPAGALPAPYMDRLLATHRPYWAALTNQVPNLVQLAYPDAPLAGSPNRFPIVLYTHGLGIEAGRGVRTENTHKLLELASHGYVVLAIDHTDAYGLVLPPNRLVVGKYGFVFNFLDDRLKDIRLLLDLLTQLNAEDAVFSGRLDLERIGILGWSFGGGTSAEACRTQDRLKAAVLLDGYLGSMPTVMNQGLAKPFLSMSSTDSGLGADNLTLFNKASRDAYYMLIQSAAHEAFTDNAWILSPSTASRRRARAMNACLLAFFDKYLKGVDNGLLENPAAVYSDVTQFRKK